MNIFVGNLSAAVTATDLRRLFAGYGTIINALVMRDTDTGLPLGYGHVYVVPDRAAREAIVNLDRVHLKGSPVSVRECIYRVRQERRLRRSLWRGNERRVAEARRHYGHGQTPRADSPSQRLG